MNYLSRDDLLDLHTFALERYGGRLGIRSQDRLIAVLGAPQQVMFGVELYPDLASKTATLGFMVLKNRPFNAANEATALLGMLRMLQINSAALDPRLPSKLAAVLRSVLHSDLDRDDLAAWLREELAGSEKVQS